MLLSFLTGNEEQFCRRLAFIDYGINILKKFVERRQAGPEIGNISQLPQTLHLAHFRQRILATV